MSKQTRQKAMKDLIHEFEIDTQEELCERLNALGFDTTQATVSRDIRELKIKKITFDGKHKYVLEQDLQTENMMGNRGSYQQVLKTSILSIDHAENIIVVKTVPGMAMAAGAAIDDLKIEGIMGCIAGDDTIFLAIKKADLAEGIIGEIKHVAKYAY